MGAAPKYMFDYSYERVIFGSQQPRGPVYLNTYSISQFYESLIKSFDLPVRIFKRFLYWTHHMIISIKIKVMHLDVYLQIFHLRYATGSECTLLWNVIFLSEDRNSSLGHSCHKTMLHWISTAKQKKIRRKISIDMLVEMKRNNFQRWETLSYTKKIDKDDGFGSPLVTYCTTQNSNITLQLECLRKFKF